MKAVIRKGARLLAALAAFLLLVLLGLGLAVKPLLNSPAAGRAAVIAVESLTGLSCRLERIRFAYPFRLTVEGLYLEGEFSGFPFEVYAAKAALVSGPKALLRARIEEVRFEGVEIDVTMGTGSGQGAGAPADVTPFEMPGWVWRVGRAELRIDTARLHSRQGSFPIDGLHASWTHPGEDREATVRLSLTGQAGQPSDLVLRVTPQSVTALSGPTLLPVLDLADLAAFAGLERSVSGTLSGVAFPVPGGPYGAEAFYLDLLSEDLALGAGRGGAGFSRGSLHLSGHVILPGRGAGLAVFLDPVEASLEGVTFRGGRAGPALEHLDLSGSLDYDTLNDSAAWSVEGRDGRRNLHLRADGSLEGVLSGRLLLSAFLSAEHRDVGALAGALSPRPSLPEGTGLEGAVRASATLKGTLESMEVSGSLTTSGLDVSLNRSLRVPLLLEAAFSGTRGGGGLEGLRVETKKLQLGDITGAEASVDYQPPVVRVTAALESAEAGRLVSLLGPESAARIPDLEWGGTLDLSGHAEMGLGEGSSIRGDFEARLRDGMFASPDYQKMGEGIDFHVNGTFRIPPNRSSVDVFLDAAFPKGEIVIGELYGNLAGTRPGFQADLRYDLAGETVRLRSAGLSLEGVGEVALEGGLDRGPGGVEGAVEIRAGPLRLGGLLDRALREGMGALYPGIEEMSAGGTLALEAELNLENGGYRAEGKLTLEEARFEDPSRGLAVGGIGAELPFSLFSAPGAGSRGQPSEGTVRPGTLTLDGVEWKGLEIPRIRAGVLLEGNRLTMTGPVRIEVAGGSVKVEGLSFQGLGTGPRQGRASLEIEGLSLAPLAKAAADRAVEGRVSGRVEELAFDEGTWRLAGRFAFGVGEGELRVEEITFEAPLSGHPSGSCAVRAKAVPVEALAGGFTEIPLSGTLEGDFPLVRLSGGRLETEGSMTLSAFGGTVAVSGVGAQGVPGAGGPVVRLDADLREIDLAALTSPMKFGSISGVMEGHVHGLEVQPEFPYALAFDARLETVRRRGVPRRIDADAVKTLSRIGGSGQLGAVLSRGLYRFFDQYHYRKMGIRATLEDGWLEVHGIEKGDKEYLITRARRIPNLSMPIEVLTENRKIRFDRWLKDVLRAGSAPAARR